MDKRKGLAVGLGAASVALIAIYFAKRGEEAPPAPPPEEPEEPEEGLASLYGRVTSQETGEVLAGASLSLGQWILFADANGDYLFFEVEPGSYTLNVTKDGYEGISLEVDLVEGNNELNIQLVPSTAEEPEEPEESVEITGVTVEPTTLTGARHEYETGLGIGYWGDPFNIGITYKNLLDTDIWLRPDYALGKLNGQQLEVVGEEQVNGFDAKSLLYFRLLLSGGYVEGDYSMTKKWQNPFDARGQNVLSNMVLGIYDPDDVPRTCGGGDYWIKIAPGASVTATKEAHLSGNLTVKSWQCVICNELFSDWSTIYSHFRTDHPDAGVVCWGNGCWFTDGSGEATIEIESTAEGVVGNWDLCAVSWKAYYFVYDPGYGQQRVGSHWVTVNWRPIELPPAAIVIPELITITA